MPPARWLSVTLRRTLVWADGTIWVSVQGERAMLDRRRNRDRPGDELVRHALDLGDDRKAPRADRPEPDATVSQREHGRAPPVSSVPPASRSIVSNGDVHSLQRARGDVEAGRDWSTSTPIPHTPCSCAASRTPRPQALATWKTTRNPCAIGRERPLCPSGGRRVVRVAAERRHVRIGGAAPAS